MLVISSRSRPSLASSWQHLTDSPPFRRSKELTAPFPPRIRSPPRVAASHPPSLYPSFSAHLSFRRHTAIGKAGHASPSASQLNPRSVARCCRCVARAPRCRATQCPSTASHLWPVAPRSPMSPPNTTRAPLSSLQLSFKGPTFLQTCGQLQLPTLLLRDKLLYWKGRSQWMAENVSVC